MPAFTMTAADLAPFATIPAAKAEAMIADAVALAARVAPCIKDDAFTEGAAALAVLRGAILRWHDAGSGGRESAAIGGVSVGFGSSRRSLFWPSEIEQLQELCASGSTGAFSIDTAPCFASDHLPWCNLMFGANYCSCGFDLANGIDTPPVVQPPDPIPQVLDGGTF